MNPRFHPSLLTLDNAMEDFMQEWKQGLPVHPSGKERVSGTVEGHGDEGKARFAKSESGGSTTPEMAGSRSVTFGRGILRDSVVTCHKYDDAAQTEQVGTQGPPVDSRKSHFSVAGLLALLGVAAYVIGCVWQAVEQF